MPPTLKKLKGHIALGLSVRACPVVGTFKNNLNYGFLNFIKGFFVKKSLTCVFKSK